MANRLSHLNEEGSISIIGVVGALVLVVVMALVFDLSAAFAQRASLSNDLSAARDLTMDTDELIYLKNIDNGENAEYSFGPGQAMAEDVVQIMKANGYIGTLEFWFVEEPSSAEGLPTSKRAWAWGISGTQTMKTYFASFNLFNDTSSKDAYTITDGIVAHAVPYSSGRAWRPSISAQLGYYCKYSFTKSDDGTLAANLVSYHGISTTKDVPQDVYDQLSAAHEEAVKADNS